MQNLTDIRQSVSRQKCLKPWHQKKAKKLRRRLNRWNFKQFQTLISYKANSTWHLVEYIDPKNTSKKCLKCGKLSRCSSNLFTCKYCGFIINRHFQATANIIDVFLERHNVASNSDPAEGRQMKTMVRELRKFKDSVVRDANHCDKMIQMYSLLST
jgi:IS605 OrfB family transposase